MEEEGYYLEFTRIGHQVKVTACDPATGIEASIFGPASTPQKSLTNLAIRKLHYVMQKRQGAGDADAPDSGDLA